MQFREFALTGPVEITPRKMEDERGYFSEIFRLEALGGRAPGVTFVQENQSFNIRAGTIRGIHFQSYPAAQGKLVRCLAGRVFDVAVDLRPGSLTFGKWVSVTLSPDTNNQLWIPVGFGHGFCTLEPNSIVNYSVTEYYSPQNDKGVAWDDPDIAIEWPEAADPETLSDKDRRQPALADLPTDFWAAVA